MEINNNGINDCAIILFIRLYIIISNVSKAVCLHGKRNRGIGIKKRNIRIFKKNR